MLQSSRPAQYILQILNENDILRHCQARLSLQKNIVPKKTRYYLGLDISLKRTGYTVLSSTGDVKLWGFIEPSKGNILHKSGEIVDQLSDIFDHTMHVGCDWTVGIEKCMKTFFAGRMNASGLVSLAQVNGIVSFACARKTGQEPIMVRLQTKITKIIIILFAGSSEYCAFLF